MIFKQENKPVCAHKRYDYLAVIRQLEKRIGKLEQIPLGDIMPSTSNGYAVDGGGHIVGLNLYNKKLSDISFLTEDGFTLIIHLELGGTRVSDLSALAGLTALEELRLYNTQVNNLSPLAGLTALTSLDLDSTQVTDLSALAGLKALKRLLLISCGIKKLPPDILQMGMPIKWEYDFSEGIFLAGNPLESPPVEIVKQGTEAVRNYFKTLKEKKSVRLLESKLLIVGNGEVGKTTLMRKLMDNDFEVEIGKEPTTHGIKIKPWQLQCPLILRAGKTVKVHFWDFGGQAIYHATHQFFLTKRSLYLFVWEARKEEEAQSFDYWFNIIKLLSDESPVIVVMNKSDVRIKYLDEASFKEKFKNIAAFFQVSCVTGDGIAQLTEQIRYTLAGMDHLYDRLPRVWMDIRDTLKKDKRDYIPLEEYFKICATFGMDEKGAMHLSNYLHDLGVILHYHDSILEHTVILNPEWATKAVYNLIDTRAIQEDKGRFEFSDLKDYWDLNTFPRHKHMELVRLMERFELSFNLTGTHTYIIPELLPPDRPKVDFQCYRRAGNLRLLYQYDFMPEGIISRFIARLYYLVKDGHYWKNGVELSYQNATALVLSEPLNRKMIISVSGTDKIHLLPIIRNELERIHRTLNMDKNEHYNEMIPCNCPECTAAENPHLYKYDVLKKFLDKGKKTNTCQVSGDEVGIGKQIWGFEPETALKELKLLPALIEAARNLQGIAKSIKHYEDSRNDVIKVLLGSYGLNVSDQTRWGRSGTGLSIGSPDFRVVNPASGNEAFMEAFNLASRDTNVITGHLTKLFNYDVNGLPQNFILVYCEAKDFQGLWQKYLDYIPEIDFGDQPLVGKIYPEKSGYNHIKLARAVHRQTGETTQVYHLFINLSPRN
jgi:small GTP-binding protein